MFREQLRKELDYQGVLVKELSSRTGIPIATLNCYLGTRATIPSVNVAVKIASALNVTVEYLVTGTPPPEKCARTYLMGKAYQSCQEELFRIIEGLEPEKCKAILDFLKSIL